MKKNGKRKGIQLYKCMACGKQFRGKGRPTSESVWSLYMDRKQTVDEISKVLRISPSTVKRLLKDLVKEWVQPSISGSGVIHLDATYFGRNTGVLLALEAGSGRVLYMSHIAHEHISDYEEAVQYISAQGYAIEGIVIDGLQKLFVVLSEYPIQMCQFHMVAIIRRKLTKNPHLKAGQELLDLAYHLKSMDKESFTKQFLEWKAKWKQFLSEKTVNPITGKEFYTHQRLRSAMVSLSFYLKWLFTFESVPGMPNTNNLIEGTFTDLKRNLRNHSGMSEENRKRFMNGFFLAYAKLHNEKGDGR